MILSSFLTFRWYNFQRKYVAISQNSFLEFSVYKIMCWWDNNCGWHICFFKKWSFHNMQLYGAAFSIRLCIPGCILYNIGTCAYATLVNRQIPDVYCHCVLKIENRTIKMRVRSCIISLGRWSQKLKSICKTS